MADDDPNSDSGSSNDDPPASTPPSKKMNPIVVQTLTEIAFTLIYHYNEIQKAWKSCGSDRICRGEKLVHYISSIFGLARPAFMLSEIIKQFTNRMWTKLQGHVLWAEDSQWNSTWIGMVVYGVFEWILAPAWEWVDYATGCLKRGDCEDDDILIWINNMKRGHCEVDDIDEDDHEVNLDMEDDEIEDNLDWCSAFWNEAPIIILSVLIWVVYAVSLVAKVDVGFPPPPPGGIGGGDKDEKEDGEKEESRKEEDKKRGQDEEKKDGKDENKEQGKEKGNEDGAKGNKSPGKKEDGGGQRKGSVKKVKGKSKSPKKQKSKEKKEKPKKSESKPTGESSKSISKKASSNCVNIKDDDKMNNDDSGTSDDDTTSDSGSDSESDGEKDTKSTDKGTTTGQTGAKKKSGKCRSRKPRQEVLLSCPCCRVKYSACFPDPLAVFCSDCGGGGNGKQETSNSCPDTDKKAAPETPSESKPDTPSSPPVPSDPEPSPPSEPKPEPDSEPQPDPVPPNEPKPEPNGEPKPEPTPSEPNPDPCPSPPPSDPKPGSSTSHQNYYYYQAPNRTGNSLHTHCADWQASMSSSNLSEIDDSLEEISENDLHQLLWETAIEQFDELVECLEPLCPDCDYCHTDHFHTGENGEITDDDNPTMEKEIEESESIVIPEHIERIPPPPRLEPVLDIEDQLFRKHKR